MNAEALVGTVLGTCTLQQLIGQGGMGAVYLAQQSRPRRQVAVKVLLPATALKPQHLAAFLERFRRETDAAASLEHPNIMPVYEYGERDGLAYLVMPYISGGTLRDVMEREGQIILPKAINYLEQLAAALDFAHSRGVIHRDIKPANILLTQEGRLLLTDFGLVKIINEDALAQVRLTGAGAPVGTPDYMSPEQVMGHEVDGRADLYSLGIILFQMLTATTPFQGETPMQIAAQQLHSQPPAPRRFRPGLPASAEQVILKALSKRPSDRYPTGLELVTAFRLAFAGAESRSSLETADSFADSTFGASGMYSRRGLFDPTWQTGTMPAAMVNGQERSPNVGTPLAGVLQPPQSASRIPVPPQDEPVRSTGLLSRTGMFPRVGTGNTGALPVPGFMQSPATPANRLSTVTSEQPAAFPPAVRELSPTTYAAMGNMVPSTPAGGIDPFAQSGINQMSPSLRKTTGSLMAPNYEQGSQTVKLTGPVKVVQVPVAPGRYVTGLLPVPPVIPPPAPVNPVQKIMRNVALVVAVILLLAGSVAGFVVLRSHLGQSAKNGVVTTSASSAQGTSTTKTTATPDNSILLDPLTTNIRNLPEGISSTRSYVFKKDGYHITNLGKEGVAVVVQYTLPNEALSYQLTMKEFQGDDNSPVNSFGMIFRYTQNSKGVSTFYSFEVVNTPGDNGKYWFYKYDSSRANPWTPLWSQNFGAEFHEGHAPNSINTFKILEKGSTFTFLVNGKVVGKPITDKSYPTGFVGMLVNLEGTEVAFSNLAIYPLITAK